MEGFLQFPEGFFWGAASSSYQTEGGNFNDWTFWEKENCGRLAKETGKGPENFVNGLACDHYRRYCEDFDLGKTLGLNACRISLEWSRIEPEEGKFDEKELAHYKEVIAAMKARNLTPFVCLWHFTLPVWFRDKGGWEAKTSPDDFSRYAEKVADVFGKEITFWHTLNEPFGYALLAYAGGVFPPRKKNPLSTFQVVRNLAETHKKAYKILKSANNLAQIGTTESIAHFRPKLSGLAKNLNRGLAHILRSLNFCFFNQTRDYQDFFGLNYYFSCLIDLWLRKDKSLPLSDVGWELYPEGLYHILKDLKKFKKPIYVAECGLADAADINRPRYLSQTVKSVYRAIKEGVDVRGYFYWSLTDNFEWERGFWPRFGLIEIDYKDFTRKIRPSGFLYAKIIKENGIMANGARMECRPPSDSVSHPELDSGSVRDKQMPN